MVAPAAASVAAASASASSSGPASLRPVVRTLYRALLRQALQYAAVAHQSGQTVQHELDRLLPTQQALSTAGGKAERLSIAAIPIGTSASPAIAIAISPSPPPLTAVDTASGNPRSLTLSSAAAPSTPLSASVLSSSSSSSSSPISPTESMSPAIARLLLRSQFGLHLSETRPARVNRLISTAFTALRKIKDRQATLTSSLSSPAFAAPAATSPSSSLSSPMSHITPTLSAMQSVALPPLLHTLSTSATTTSTHTRIHIVTSHFKSIPAFRTASSPSSPSPTSSSLSSSSSSPTATSTSSTTHLFTYTLSITNTHPTASIQLLSRYWAFTASSGHRQEVTGEGVVGKQPIIGPGATFHYSSNVNLQERKGRMEGKLHFRLLPQEAEAGRGDGEGVRRRGSRRGGPLRRKRPSKAEDSRTEEATVEGEVASTEAAAEAGEGDRGGEAELFEAAVGPVLLATTEVHERH